MSAVQQEWKGLDQYFSAPLDIKYNWTQIVITAFNSGDFFIGLKNLQYFIYYILPLLFRVRQEDCEGE